jgi:hypothetical protein
MVLTFAIVGGGSQTAQAGTKPDGLGNLTGVVDILVHNGTKTAGAFHCIAYNSHDGTTDEIKSAAQCFSDLPGNGIGDPNSAVPSRPLEAGDAIPGPPPPPAYSTYEPAKGYGDYFPTGAGCPTDPVPCTIVQTCFPNIGGSMAPNIVAVLTVIDPKAQLLASGKQSGTVDIYGNQPNSICDSAGALPPFGLPSFAGLPINLNPADDSADCLASDCDQVPWRGGGTPDADYDDDGCTDEAELDKTLTNKCGDDPWNPFDSATTEADLDGIYSILTTAIRPNHDGVNAGPTGIIAGASFHCISQLDFNAGITTVAAKLFCYIDNPAIAVNAKSNTIGGDGIAGAAPPRGAPMPVTTTDPKETGANCYPTDVPNDDDDGDTVIDDGCPWALADVDNKQTTLSGTIAANVITLTGCFEDVDGNGALGDVYVDASVNLHTGLGTVDIYIGQPDACAGSPMGAVTFDDAALQMAKQPNNGKGTVADGTGARDSDQDGCSDSEELSNPASAVPTDPNGPGKKGDLRDPYNMWDFYDVDGPGGGPPNPDRAVDLPNDILGVILRYTPTAGPAGYLQSFDRGSTLPGSNAWNKRQPDGTIDLPNDILGVILQYQHNCTAA